MEEIKLIIINGPNLNLLGKREISIYGRKPFEDFFEHLQMEFPSINLHYFQSNYEGALIDKLQEVGYSYNGIILNAGALSHTSIALADTLAAIETPVIEVHISNVAAREPFRHHSYLSANSLGTITGLGLEGYKLGIQYFLG